MTQKNTFLICAMIAGLFCLTMVPQAGAWCFTNHTELPLKYWVEDVHKDTVGIRETECWPGALEGKGGARWMTIHEVSHPRDHNDAYWWVPVQVPKNGDAIITGGKAPSQMTVEVTNDDGEQIYMGQLDGPHDTVKMP